MSHLDELDEFEAELELRLKKEYTAVFGLFRYCVLTQDATYLCNRSTSPSLAAELPVLPPADEDVWVLGQEPPTRIIPRAEVWTSSDVTVERSCGARARLAPHRRGARREDRRSLSARRRHLVVVRRIGASR
jgi:hypothetical protein